MQFLQVAIAAKKQKDLGDGVTDSEAAELLTSVGLADQVTFVKGDKVKVIEGDLQGLWGYVHAVRDDNTIEMMPQLKELTEVLPFPPSQLAKTFEVSPFAFVPVLSAWRICPKKELFKTQTRRQPSACRNIDSQVFPSGATEPQVAAFVH